MSQHVVNFSNELNPQQWKAVQQTEGPVLILAGAGSGKTRALTYRLAYLVASGLASSDEIYCVTFTNKAAREMLDRAGSLLHRVGVHVPPFQRLWISTFHSSCVRILKEQIHVLGYQPGFVIYDDQEQLALIKKVCRLLNINDKIYSPKTFQAMINSAKNKYVGPEDIREKFLGHFLTDKLESVYVQYQRELKMNNALDFGDLIFKTVEVFEKSEDVLKFYQNQFKYLMVDEYQDTNHVQYKMVKMLSQGRHNLCVVGDEDQSIYSWRGADISNILNFEKDFPDAHIVKLEENYRSTGTIVNAATKVISRNTERKDKTLWTSNDKGEPIQIREEATDLEESKFVVKTIENLRNHENRALSDFAVFYRTNAQSRVLEDQLRGHRIAYQIIGGIKFYDRAEIKDIIAYMRVLHNPKDSISLKRIINTPARGIGKTTIEKLEEFADQKTISLFDGILPALKENLLDRGATKKVLDFYEKICLLREKSQTLKPSEIYHEILDSTEYIQKLKLENTPESLARVENLEELDTAIIEFEKERGSDATLHSFLEEIALVTEKKESDPQEQEFVTLMTLHVSKGLEFPVVFIVGMEDGLFPSERSLEEFGGENPEEERRLFYVGMTRARERLFLTHCRSRRVWGSETMYPASRFLSEIPEEFVMKSTGFARPKVFEQNLNHFRKSSSKSVFETETEVVTERAFPDYEDGDAYQSGMKVRHPSFGVGVIQKTEGNGEDQKVTILFGDRSTKKFVAKFARLERV